MNFSEYVKGIDFRFYQPHQKFRWYRRLEKLASLSFLRISLELANTRISEEEKGMKSRLGPLCSIPKMSTFAVGAMINRAVSALPDGTCFVNVGVWNGFTLLTGMVGNPGKACIGIDNFSQFGGPKKDFLSRFDVLKSERHHFYDMDYVEYFSRIHTSPIGFYIYDGEHSYDNQLKGLKIAEPFFSENCIIMVDDTNWTDPRQATLDFIKGSANKYEMLLDVNTSYNGHPTFWNGIMIFRRC